MPETAITPEQKEVAKKLLGELNSGSYEAVFSAQEVVSAIKMFVDVGEKPKDILMRADFADDEQALAGVRVLAKARDFHDEVAQQEVHEAIASRVSIGGKRTDILLKGVTGGQQSSPHKANYGDKIKKAAGIE